MCPIKAQEEGKECAAAVMVDILLGSDCVPAGLNLTSPTSIETPNEMRTLAFDPSVSSMHLLLLFPHLIHSRRRQVMRSCRYQRRWPWLGFHMSERLI
jgi:hypothetical protein